MKFSSSQLAYLIGNREARGNLRALLKYVLTLLALITLYAVAVPRHQGAGRGRTALLDHRLLLDAGRHDHARVRRHHVHERHRPAVQHRRAALGRRPAAGDAAVHVHQPLLRAVARGAGAAAGAARGARGHARPRHPHRVRRHRRRPGRAAADRAHPVLRDRAGSDDGRPDDRRGHLGHRRRQRQQRHLPADERGRRPHAPGQLRRHDEHQHHDHGPRDRPRPADRRRSSRRRTRSTCCS